MITYQFKNDSNRQKIINSFHWNQKIFKKQFEIKHHKITSYDSNFLFMELDSECKDIYVIQHNSICSNIVKILSE